MQGMSAPHDLQPSDWHHAVIIRTDALVNTKAQACNGIPIQHLLLELIKNNLQLFTVSILLESISTWVLMTVHYTQVYLVTGFFYYLIFKEEWHYGNCIFPRPSTKWHGGTYTVGSHRKS